MPYSDKIIEVNVLHPLDDYTVVIGECVVTREVVSRTLCNRWVHTSMHICPQHNMWIIWPQHIRQINQPQGPQAIHPMMFDRNETLWLIP